MSMIGRPHDAGCSDCHDTGVVRDWWADSEHGLRACTRPDCTAAEELAAEREESDRSGTQCPLRSDLAGPTPSPGGASDDAGVFTARRAS